MQNLILYILFSLRVYSSVRIFCPSFHLVQTDERSTAHIAPLQILHTLLGSFHSVDDNVVKGATRGRYGDVIFLIDSSKVSLEEINKLFHQAVVIQ